MCVFPFFSILSGTFCLVYLIKCWSLLCWQCCFCKPCTASSRACSANCSRSCNLHSCASSRSRHKLFVGHHRNPASVLEKMGMSLKNVHFSQNLTGNAISRKFLSVKVSLERRQHYLWKSIVVWSEDTSGTFEVVGTLLKSWKASRENFTLHFF